MLRVRADAPLVGFGLEVWIPLVGALAAGRVGDCGPRLGRGAYAPCVVTATVDISADWLTTATIS